MPRPIEPPELAELVEVAERPREGDWTLRSSLVRYAQRQPERASQVLTLVRRLDAAVQAHLDVIVRDGVALLQSQRGSAGAEAPGPVAGLLAACATLDGLAELLVTWALDPSRERPDAAVDEVVIDLTGRLDVLGVPREQRPEGRPGRG